MPRVAKLFGIQFIEERKRIVHAQRLRILHKARAFRHNCVAVGRAVLIAVDQLARTREHEREELSVRARGVQARTGDVAALFHGELFRRVEQLGPSVEVRNVDRFAFGCGFVKRVHLIHIDVDPPRVGVERQTVLRFVHREFVVRLGKKVFRFDVILLDFIVEWQQKVRVGRRGEPIPDHDIGHLIRSGNARGAERGGQLHHRLEL